MEPNIAAPAALQARTALSAPVRLEYEGTRWKLPRCATMRRGPTGWRAR